MMLKGEKYTCSVFYEKTKSQTLIPLSFEGLFLFHSLIHSKEKTKKERYWIKLRSERKSFLMHRIGPLSFTCILDEYKLARVSNVILYLCVRSSYTHFDRNNHWREAADEQIASQLFVSCPCTYRIIMKKKIHIHALFLWNTKSQTLVSVFCKDRFLCHTVSYRKEQTRHEEIKWSIDW